MIIDTDVLIWYLRGNIYAKKTLTANIPFKIPIMSYMELLHGMQNKNELLALQKQIKKWSTEILQINESISSYAMYLVENYRLSHSMEAADAIIAATAIEKNEILLTANYKHYSYIPNIQIQKFKAGL